MFRYYLYGARSLWFVLGVVGTFFTGGQCWADVEPYEARVITPRALVHSGPGEKFYPTATLAPGDVVEVYREEAGGWLGIRPPKGSFSHVLEEQLDVKGGGLAEVRDDDVACRIGSQLSDKRNAVQVRLKRGEVVEIVGTESIDGASWCKIAPPAGEFRWVHAASVEKRGTISEPELAAGNDAEVVPASATGETTPVKEEAKTEVAAVDEESKPLEQASATGDNWRATSVENVAAISPAPVADAKPAELASPPLVPLTPVTPSPTASATPPAALPQPPVAAGSAPASAAAVPIATAAPPAGDSDLARKLTDIEVRLSRMASAPPQLWNTERLQRDTEQLLAQARTPADRDLVKATMGKIDQFTALARRYQQPTAGAAAGGQPITPIGPAPGGAAGAADGAGRFDAVGVLRPVVSKRPGAPQFALVDDRGQVITFVTPSPDVNLQPYLGRRVGIAGNRGFIPEFNRAHVTAGRVTPITERMMR